MKRLTVFASALMVCAMLLMAGPAMAGPATCSNTTLQDLINLGSAGCQIQDKIFSDFTYTGTDAASAINASVKFTTAGSQDIHGWLFENSLHGGKWIDSFTLSYKIAVDAAYPNVFIIASKDQINSGFIPNGVVMTDTQNPVGVLVTKGLVNQETFQIAYPGLKSITTTSVANIPNGDVLLSYEQNWTERTRPVPEPSLLLLLGAGLLGIAGLRRK